MTNYQADYNDYNGPRPSPRDVPVSTSDWTIPMHRDYYWLMLNAHNSPIYIYIVLAMLSCSIRDKNYAFHSNYSWKNYFILLLDSIVTVQCQYWSLHTIFMSFCQAQVQVQVGQRSGEGQERVRIRKVRSESCELN